MPYAMMVYPIVKHPGDTCMPVENIGIDAYGSLVMVNWDSAAGNRWWQLSYGPVGTAPEDGTIIDCTEPSAKLLNLDVGSNYVLYVRPLCRLAGTVYGEWSEGVVFNPQTGTAVGIGASPSDVYFTLKPNPATESVTIASAGTETATVSIVDMAGREVLRREGARLPLTLSTAALARGVYTVSVATEGGTAARRLVVQ